MDEIVWDFAGLVQFRKKGKRVEGIGKKVAQLMDH